MRAVISAVTVVATGVAVSAQSLGTKADVVAKTASGPIVRPMDLLQIVVALAVVGWLLKWALPKVAGRLASKPKTSPGSTISVDETLSLGNGHLQVVTVRGRALLLAVSATGTTFLTDLTPATAPGTTAAPEETPAFFEMLDAADGTSEPTALNATTPSDDPGSMSMDDAIALISAARKRLDTPEATGTGALDRLNRLTGGR
ncbi:MAG: flagellar biosynthetic protein FliO [Armatimonadetes bacterium]|nr:flagellar biosynthetic protein FliO [Armatimonadota bacterium]